MLIESVKCRADVDGQVFDVQAKNSTGAWVSLLVEPVTCGPKQSAAKVLPGASYSGVLLFAFRVVVSTPATATQFIADVVVGPGPPPPVATLRECTGSGPGWNCDGMLWATIPLADGSLVQLMGAAMLDFQPPAGITWAVRK
jgi:hypothetical protein